MMSLVGSVECCLNPALYWSSVKLRVSLVRSPVMYVEITHDYTQVLQISTCGLVWPVCYVCAASYSTGGAVQLSKPSGAAVLLCGL